MLKQWRRRRELRRIERLQIPPARWEAAIADWPVAARYQGAARQQLYETTLGFLLRKQIESGGGLVVTEAMRLKVATMAAVPVLALNLDWYQGWYAVILYPDVFVPRHEWQDASGVVHVDNEPHSGEAWYQGPVILSWADVETASASSGHNVVIHEMAHKLDMQGHGANGQPPLHQNIDPQQWHDDFTAAWQWLEHADRMGSDTVIDPYALENAGEFFAVVSECFFEAPARLNHLWPAVYAQLTQFYRQDPLQCVTLTS